MHPGGGGGALGVNLPLLRNHNEALVLDLLRTAREDGISRLELADRTGLTPQAVSKITARLRDEELVTEAGRRASTGGKPRTVLRLVPSAAYAVGVQLDRDELTAVLLDLAGTRIATRVVSLDLGAGPDTVTGQATQEVRTLLAGSLPEGAADGGGPDAGETAGARVLGVGVAMPGPLDHAAGVPHRVTGYPEWDGYRLRDELACRLGLPVVLDKDTNAAALGLLLRGTGGSFAYLHLGTGIGAGLVLDGALYRGVRTGAGEFGHQVVQLDGPVCECGKRGCIEALCLAAVARGDIDEATRVLGTGVANLVELLDIDRVLLGGRVVAAAEAEFIRGVRATLVSRTRARVAPAGGGAYRVAEGAAQLLLAPVFGRAEVAYVSHPR
ncbi:ROK family transcriptional regulator [Streptomyces formicae]|uniref:ROK family transcriptional regulator n=2 Tax=Streptomyces formicae TaxID=1616117 RepID=A0ABY3X223_9ACTN|nr:ROK family transcriptional regulator [Streptomyces formicae]UNM16821.1 ROK family transcriptional regulator [Streptomyces formicae]